MDCWENKTIIIIIIIIIQVYSYKCGGVSGVGGEEGSVSVYRLTHDSGVSEMLGVCRLLRIVSFNMYYE